MKTYAGLCALLTLVLLVIAIGSLLRVPPNAPPDRADAGGDRAEVMPPPPPSVARTEDVAPVGAALELSLLDAVTKEPVEGATVELKEVKAGEGERRYGFFEAVSGVYRLEERPAEGPHALNASSPGYECLRWSFSLTARDRGLSAELTPLTDVVVIVQDPSGTPVPAAAVALGIADWAVFRCVHPEAADETVRLERIRRTESDAEGSAVFDGLIPGRGYSVQVTAAGMEPVRLEGLDVEPEPLHIVEVTVEHGARIIGTIRDSDGAPGKGFTVSCRRRGSDSRSRVVTMERERVVLSRDDGYFEFQELSPGFKRLIIHRRARSRLETCVVHVTARRGKTHDCGVVGPVPLSEGGANLRVRVVDESGSGLPQARVSIMKQNPDPIEGSLTTDESGWCSVLGLNPGLVSGGAHLDGFISGKLRVRLEAGEEKDVLVTLKRMDPSRFRELIVRLRDSSAGNLALTEIVERKLTPHVESEAGEWVPPNYRSGSDDRGDYLRLTALRPGSYRVKAVGQGLISRGEPVFVEDPRSEVELTVDEAIEVRGRIVDASSGDGVSGFVRRLLEARADPPNRARACGVRSDPEGRFGLRAFGRWEERGLIEVSARGYGTEVVEIQPGAGDLGEIALSRRGK